VNSNGVEVAGLVRKAKQQKLVSLEINAIKKNLPVNKVIEFQPF